MKVVEIRNQMVLAALELHKRKLWEHFTNYDCFSVEIQGLDDPMLGVILGHAEEEYGMNLFRGPEAHASLSAMLSPVPQGDDLFDAMDLLGFTMEAFGKLDSERKGWIRKAGLHPGNSESVPCFLVKSPGYRPLLPEPKDQRCLLMVLLAILAADDRGTLEATELSDPNGLCTLTLHDDPHDPLVSVTYKPWSTSEKAQTVHLSPQRPALEGLPKHNATWLVGWHDVAMGIEGDDRAMKLLLVVDQANGLVLHQYPAFADRHDEVVEALFKTMQTGGSLHPSGLPNKIQISSRKVFEVAGPLLEKAGVQCEFQPSIPMLDEVIGTLREFLAADTGTH